MSKKSKNRAAKNKQTAAPQKNNPPMAKSALDGVDIQSNPENIITIELPDIPDKTANSATASPSVQKKQTSQKKDKPNKSKTRTDEKSVKNGGVFKNSSPAATKTDDSTEKESASSQPLSVESNTDDTALSEKTAPNKSSSSAKDTKTAERKFSLSDITAAVCSILKKAVGVISSFRKSSEKPQLTPEQLAAYKKRKTKRLSKAADIVIICVLIIAALLMILPIFFTVMQSFKPMKEFNSIPQSFFPKRFSVQAFGALFNSTGDAGITVLRFMFNTLLVTIIVVVLRIAVNTAAAYALAAIKAPMLKTINIIVNISIAVTPALAYVMNYVFFAKTGIADTLSALILPYIASPLCIVLLRESIRRISSETILAAQLDGCSHTMVLRKIVIPQIKPAITAVSVLTIWEMGKISGGAAVFSESLDTLSGFMETLYNRSAVGEIYALAALMLIPVVVLFVIFRKSLLQAMAAAVIKKEM